MSWIKFIFCYLETAKHLIDLGRFPHALLAVCSRWGLISASFLLRLNITSDYWSELTWLDLSAASLVSGWRRAGGLVRAALLPPRRSSARPFLLHRVLSLTGLSIRVIRERVGRVPRHHWHKHNTQLCAEIAYFTSVNVYARHSWAFWAALMVFIYSRNHCKVSYLQLNATTKS